MTTTISLIYEHHGEVNADINTFGGPERCRKIKLKCYFVTERDLNGKKAKEAQMNVG